MLPADHYAHDTRVKNAVSIMRERFDPQEISLFGSRARGDFRSESDWDFLVLVSDDARIEVLSPIYAWETAKAFKLPADIIVELVTDFRESVPVANTLAREINDERIILFTK
jgi:predicted nucleotidyltransferase